MRSAGQAYNWTGFLALWAASGTGYFAFWLMQVALALFAQQLTRSPLLVSGVTFALTVPAFVFGLLAEVVVDRSDRRSLLLGITLLRLVIFGLATLAAFLDLVSIPLLYAPCWASNLPPSQPMMSRIPAKPSRAPRCSARS